MVAETTCPVRKRTEVVRDQANQDDTSTVNTVHDLLEDDEANDHRVRRVANFWGFFFEKKILVGLLKNAR